MATFYTVLYYIQQYQRFIPVYKVNNYHSDKQLRLLGMTMLYGKASICNDNKGLEFNDNVVRGNKLVIVSGINRLH